MQDHLEQHLDKLAKKVIKSKELEAPSLDFTSNIMKHIEASEVSHVTVYKPLISKRGWFIIVLFVIGVLAYFILNGSYDTKYIGNVDLSIISNNKLTNTISGISISKILTYAIGVGGLVWFIQVPLIKQLLQRDLNY